MPIKLKKTNIEFDVDNPDSGYIILGFDDNGQLVYKDEHGNYDTIIPKVSTAKFKNLETDYLTIGYRAAGQHRGLYSYAQGENNTSSGYTSMSQGISAVSEGLASRSRGENVSAGGDYSHSSGKGASTAQKLFSNGLNSFVHSYADYPSGTYSDYSVILGGQNHNIGQGGENTAIIGGEGNTINTDVKNSAIIACEGTTLNTSDIVYVPRLSLRDNGSSMETPPNGTIFYDGSDIKARLGGSNVSLTVQTTGLVTNVTAGDGLSGSGTSDVTITMGTPGTCTASTDNGVTATSHKHAITTDAVSSTSSHLATGAQIHTYITDLGYTSNTGTITGVSTGSNLTGGGTSGSVTLTVVDDPTFDTLTVTNDVTANDFVLSSDIRLKENIFNIEKSNIDDISIKSFNFIKDEEKRLRYGVIAQELEKIHPELVSENENGYKKVSYIDYLLLKINEKDNQINKLEKRIDKLEKFTY